MATEHSCDLFCGCLRYSIFKHHPNDPARGTEPIGTAPGVPAGMHFPQTNVVTMPRPSAFAALAMGPTSPVLQDRHNKFGVPGPVTPIKTTPDTGTDVGNINDSGAGNSVADGITMLPIVPREGKKVPGMSARLKGPMVYSVAGNGDDVEDGAGDSGDDRGEAVKPKQARGSFTSSIAASSSACNQTDQSKRFSAKELSYMNTAGGHKFVQFAGDKTFPN